jgi:hypothetical protein
MEAVRTSETSVHFSVTTRRYIQEDSKLQFSLAVTFRTKVCLATILVFASKPLNFLICCENFIC